MNFGTHTKDEPDYSIERYNNGIKKLQENKPEIACKYFEESVRLNPKFIDGYYNLGLVYKKLSRLEESCEAWKTGYQLGDSEEGSLYERYCAKKE